MKCEKCEKKDLQIIILKEKYKAMQGIRKDIRLTLSKVKAHLIKLDYAVKLAENHLNPKGLVLGYNTDRNILLRYHSAVSNHTEKLKQHLEKIENGITKFAEQEVESMIRIHIEERNKEILKEYEM